MQRLQKVMPAHITPAFKTGERTAGGVAERAKGGSGGGAGAGENRSNEK